jgi:hypothetical protein
MKRQLTKNLLPLASVLGMTTYHTQSHAYEAGDFILIKVSPRFSPMRKSMAF